MRQLLDTEVANDFSMFADATWLVGQVLWAEAAARSGHRPAAVALYQRLLPWHDQFATTHITVQGGVAHYLGLLAHTLDLHDEADQWFSQALAFHEAMEAPFFVAMTQTAWAGLLADRDRRATPNGRGPWPAPRYLSRRSAATATSNAMPAR